MRFIVTVGIIIVLLLLAAFVYDLRQRRRGRSPGIDRAMIQRAQDEGQRTHNQPDSTLGGL